MNSFLLIDAKSFSDFIERFFINAITPPILILLLILIIYHKKIQLKAIKPFVLILILYLTVDLLLRLYYTFVLNMENQTRYFLVQAIFYLIPASLGWEYLISKNPEKKKNISIAICLIVFLFGSIKSLKPKWNNPEYEQFGMIIKKDPAKYKYVYEIKRDDNGELKLDKDYRSLYYAGIYRDNELRRKIHSGRGAIFYISKYKLEEVNGEKAELVSSYKDKKFLYRFSGKN